MFHNFTRRPVLAIVTSLVLVFRKNSLLHG